MGASSSSEVAKLQRQRAALTAEKRRLEQVALAQFWAEKRLQEEQRQKEAAEKWRREQQLKAESELQRKMDELKMQKRLQIKEQRQKEAVEKLRREEQLKKAEYELLCKMKEMKMQQRLLAEEQRQKEAVEKLRREEQLKKAEYELQCKMKEMKMQQRLLEEEQRQKEVVEKLRREEQLKDAEYKLRREMDEMKMQQRLQTEQQKILQQASPLPVGNTWASTHVKDTVPVQGVSPYSTAGKPTVTRPLATAAPLIHPPVPSKPPTSLDTNKVTVCEPSILPKAKPQPNKTNPFETCESRMNASNVRYDEWSIVDYVMKENALNKNTAANVIKLLNENNTVPFIARYRRGMTQGMKEDELRNVKKSYEQAKLIKERAASIIKTVDKQGRWTPELHAFVHESKSLRDLDRIKSIFKVANTKDIGLGTIAQAIVEGNPFAHPVCLVDLKIEGRRNDEEVKASIVNILVDTMKKDIRIYDVIKKLRSKYDMGIETNFAVTNGPVTLQRELERQKYLPYDNFKSTDKLIEHSDISNIRRGEAEKVLRLRIIVPPQFSQAFKERCLQLHIEAVKASSVHKKLISAAIDCMYDKWARPSIENWTREEIDEKAEIATMEIIVPYVKQLLLGPALKGKVVIGVFSLSQWVCRLAAVSERGNYLDYKTINPHDTDNPDAKQNAEAKLVNMVKKYNCTTLAVGNGAACKENKKFIMDVIKKKSFLPLMVSFRVVDEAGLLQQFYNCSHTNPSEFPTIAAVSVAKRLQDPIAEFVKIEPKHLVEKTYLQDVPEKKLTATLNDVIVEVVSSVGVDLNTASAILLRRVAGLDEEKAKSIVEWRDSYGPFTNRNDLMRVKGIDVKTFNQCAGFVRIMPETAVGEDNQQASQDLFNYFDQTTIHPNSYNVAKAILEAAKCNINQLGTRCFIFALKVFTGQGSAILAKKFGTSIAVIELIVDALTMEKTPIIKAKVKLDEDLNMKSSRTEKLNSKLSFDDLTTKTVLTGVVCDIKPFGVFVNVGLGRHGLIHKRTVNGMTLRIGQRVETIVNTIDRERQVFSLKVLKCI